MKLLLTLILLIAAVPVQAQNVRLQLFDHVVGAEILHDAVLPAGTEVWVVPKRETRAMRLRDGYGEVVEGMKGATRDRIGQNGYTEKSYPTTASGQRAYFVVARLPDGRLFQSYVKTGDAGMQPGFDAVQGGRISMGRVPENVRERLAASLAARIPEPPATPDAAPATDTPADRDGTDADGPTASPEALDLPAFPDTALFASESLLAASARPVPMQEAAPDGFDEGEEERAEGGSGRGWLWFLLGLAAGGAAAYFGAAAYYERLLRRQRENLLRYVPMPGNEAGRAQAEDDGQATDAEA